MSTTIIPNETVVKISKFIAAILSCALDNANDQRIYGDDALQSAVDLLAYLKTDEGYYTDELEWYNECCVDEQPELAMSADNFDQVQEIATTLCAMFNNDLTLVEKFLDQ